MADLEILTGRNYLSYSALSAYLDCSERFRLERVLNAPQSDAWWFVAGDVIHKATEILDRGTPLTPTEVFLDVWAEVVGGLKDRGVDLDALKAGGRSSKEWPNKEDGLFWLHNGPGMVEGWVNWRDARFAEGWQFLALPNGDPAIEVPIQVEFDDVLVKGYIDRVMVDPNGQVHVVDLKSGSRVPASSLQLGIYALGMQRNFGITAPLGGYYMTRKGELTEPTSLLHYTHALLGQWFSAAKRGIEAESFVPHVGPLCGGCTVAPYCKAVGGDDTPLLARRAT